jgi:hypothetical protein
MSRDVGLKSIDESVKTTRSMAGRNCKLQTVVARHVKLIKEMNCICWRISTSDWARITERLRESGWNRKNTWMEKLCSKLGSKYQEAYS